MSEQVTVKEVWNPDAPEPYQGKHGMTYEYKLTLEDGRFAVIKQKADTPAPQPGQVLEADMALLKEGGKMWRLTGVTRLGMANGAAPVQQASQPTLNPSLPGEALDITQRLIIRQNALNRATDEALKTDKEVTPELVEKYERLIWRAAAKDHEQQVLKWTESAQPEGKPISAPPGAPSGSADSDRIRETATRVGCAEPVLMAYVRGKGAESLDNLNEDQTEAVLAWLEQKAA